MNRKLLSLILAAAMLLALAACGAQPQSTPAESTAESAEESVAESAAAPETEPEPAASEAPAEEPEPSAEASVEEPEEEPEPEAPVWTAPDPSVFADYAQDNDALTFNSAGWSYDADNGVYYQLGVSYCAAPETDNETMGIYVPEEYFDAVDNGDGTYTCTVSASGEKAGYTAETAPIVLPVDTPGYSYQAAPTAYSYYGISSYLDAGFIYVCAGMRGRASLMGGSGEDLGYSGGAPYGITDLKAAVRYYRFNQDLLPGDTERLFSFGMSGGGAQSSLIGATGDSDLYYPYLESIGAAMLTPDGDYISDAICGSMCWCPITALNTADEAYEWNMGQYFDSGTRAEGTYTAALSEDLASAFGDYINALGLVSEDGEILTLTETEDGVYAAGSYYDYLVSEIETSLNNFLSDTEFPYEYTARQIQVGNTESSGGGWGGFGGGNDSSAGTTYETAGDYIASLNTDVEWVTYDEATNTATITGIAGFVTHCKSATKSVGAFDSPDNSQGENNLFGNGQNENAHFDFTEGAILAENAEKYAEYSDWVESYVADFEADLASTDGLGISMEVRNNMYNPMYYLCDYYDGVGTSNVAKYWRIRTGIAQTDTALTVEENLKLALQSCDAVESVDFATVWAQPHTTAERTGNSTENFIAWVNDCLA